MKDIQYPLELFFWNLHDEQGNVRLEVRDANRVTVFFISIKGRDFQESERLQKYLGPRIVELMNENAVVSRPVREVTADEFMKRHKDIPLVIPVVETNGHIEEVKPKRRGNPNWIKGMKRK